jgi:predicted DNA-binding ribbon-helix-helix protein
VGSGITHLAARTMQPDLERGRSGSTLVSRNVTVAGRRTSVRLEPAMWSALRELCEREKKIVHQLVTEIDGRRVESSLTAAIRIHLLQYFYAAATDDGHRQAGHGVASGKIPWLAGSRRDRAGGGHSSASGRGASAGAARRISSQSDQSRRNA